MTDHEIREYTDADAPDVATLFNESDEVWPGGFTQGKALTADDVRDWLRTMDKVAVYLAVADRHARGYCSLVKSITEERDTAYVGLLGVTPKYHKKGLGRDLLRACVGIAIEHGIRRIDLHTWAANMRAVPVYKKTGFFWVPETSVFMQNFIPMIVLAPLASDFFKGIDWYSIHQRELELVEDIELWEGMKVYTYKFNRDGKALEVKINTDSREIVYFNDENYRIALKPPGDRALKGLDTNFRLEMEKKNPVEARVNILGTGKYGISCQTKKSIGINGSTSIEIPFEIGHSTRKGTKYDPFPQVGANLEVDGKALNLALGLDVKPVVEITTFPKHTVVSVGKKRTIQIELASNSDKRIKGKLVIPDSESRFVEIDEPCFEIPADGNKTIDAAVKVKEPSVIHALVDWEMSDGRKGQTSPVDIPVLVHDAEKPSSISFIDNKFNLPSVKVVSHDLVLVGNSRGGKFDLLDPVDEKILFSIMHSAFGPPYSPSAMEYATYQVGKAGENAIEQIAPIDKAPAMKHIVKAGMLGDGWLSLSHKILNSQSGESTIGIRTSFRARLDWASVKFVYRGRIISGMLTQDDYPARREFPEMRKELDEGWICMETPSYVFGLVFGETESQKWSTWEGMKIEWKLRHIPANGEASTKPIYIYSGSGTWRDIRKGWQRLIEGRFDPLPELEIHPLKRIFTVPEIPVVGRTAKNDLVLDNERLIPANGIITVKSDKNLRIKSAKIKCTNAVRNEPFKSKIELESSGDIPGVSPLRLEFTGAGPNVHSETIALRIDPKAKVKISKKKNEWIVTNGLATIKADPDWGGGIHSFHALDREWLISPYPDKKALFSWFNPFRGGARPELMTDDDWFGRCHSEDWSISECSHDAGGLKFKGMALKSIIARDDLKGCALAVKYMLCDGHRILRVDYEIENLTDILYRAQGRLEFFLSVHPENKTLQRYDYGTVDERPAGPFGVFIPTSGWVITENQDTHESMAVILIPAKPSYPPSSYLWVENFGSNDGQHVSSWMKIQLKPHEKRSLVHYAVPCANPGEADLMRHLAKFE